MPATHEQKTPELRNDLQPQVLGLQELVALSALGRLTGPKPRNFKSLVNPEAVWSQLSPDVRDPITRSIVSEIVDTYNRRLNKVSGTPSVELGSSLADAVSAVVEKIYEQVPDMKFGANHQLGIARIIRDMDKPRALHYLDEEYVGELQDMGPESSTMWDTIGNYFTISELLRRSFLTRDPDLETSKSVKKAWEIATDRMGYLKQLGIEEPDEKFASAISDSAILELTTRLTGQADERLKTAAELFSSYAQEFPTLATYGATDLVTKMLRSPYRRDLFGQFEHAAQVLIKGGLSPNVAVHFAVRTLNGKLDPAKIDRLTGDSAKQRLFAYSGDSRDGVGSRKRQAVSDGIITGEDAGMAAHGLEFRDAMYDISESEQLSRPEKKNIFSSLREMRRNHADYTYKIEPVIGEKLADNERRQYHQNALRL